MLVQLTGAAILEPKILKLMLALAIGICKPDLNIWNMAAAKPITSKDPPEICFVTKTANTGPNTLKPELIKKSEITSVRIT